MSPAWVDWSPIGSHLVFSRRFSPSGEYPETANLTQEPVSIKTRTNATKKSALYRGRSLPVSVAGKQAGSKHRVILGQTIRRHRQRAALSQEKLAEKAELSTVFVNRVEAGKENISVDALHRIAKSLGTSLRDLFEAI